MTPAEQVARRTWTTIARAQSLRARFGEETLTDLLMLDMLPHQRAKGFWLMDTSKRVESVTGADLLLAVRGFFGWALYALQAKKLYPDDRYAGLNSGRRTREQLGKLNRFARQVHAFPLYLLYNHSDTASGQHWHCRRLFDTDQLGCTLVPSWYVKQLVELNGRRRKSFDLLNRCSDSMPWRCLFDCDTTCRRLERFFRGSVPFRRPKGASAVPRDESGEDDWWPVERLRAPWPEWLFDESTSTLTLESFDQLRAEISEVHGVDGAVVDLNSRDFDDRLYPARVLVVDQLG